MALVLCVLWGLFVALALDLDFWPAVILSGLGGLLISLMVDAARR